jgi:tetratricopeptide (TPR) repeat protein
MNVFSSSQEDRWAWQRLPRLYMMMRALQETGATDEALRGYRQLLAHPSLPDNFEIHWRTLAETATLTEKSGNTDEATTLYKKAIDLLELYRGNVDTEINKVGELVDRKSLYDRYIALLLRKKESIQALEITERKNGFIVVNALAEKTIFKSSQESTDAATQQAITNLIQTEKAARIQDNSSSMATVSVRREEIKAAQKQIDKVVDPETASLVKVPNYNQNIIKKYLERGESVLIFHVDKNTGLGASWLWLPGREKPINRQFDYAKVMKWLELIREEFSFLSDPKNIKKNYCKISIPH